MEADPSFIKKHMKDNGDGTVTVKFYQVKDFECHAKYVTVDKSSVYKPEKTGSKKNIGVTGSLWVQIYEKALAVSGIGTETREPPIGEYDSIYGGRAEAAFEWVTGTRGFVKLSYKPGYDEMYTEREKFDLGLKTVDKTTGKTVKTNKYAQDAETFRKKLEEVLNKGGVVTASAYRELAGATGQGASGELVRRGLAGKHAYSVLKLEKIDNKYYVLVRNPWSTRVSYNTNELTGKTVMVDADRKKVQGSFRIDFDTFFEHMKSIVYINKDDLAG